MTDQTPDSSYAVSAEFYDILQAETDRRLAQRRFAEAAAQARHGVLDVGAGSGVVTEVVLAASGLPVHAVEPAVAMRSALLSRLAHLGADQRARVTVHPEPLDAAGLSEVVDLAIASNVIACLEPATRRATWRAIAAALLPGGLLLFDPPPVRLPDGSRTTARLGPVRVGPDLYSAEVTELPDRGILRAVFTYRVERHGRLQREEHECFDMWPAAPELLAGELRDAGLRVVRAPSADLMAARRPSE
ncbi:class I SAM-dependent methyltransferase [Streptacidiphilus jiangxiensis]|uniref:Methyltransferase domain-containing protein n=1 Tax=Streptacidiphilus jiangxiensis TaxID=235985 RepID=A0A1H7HH62_STRJI|nr:class I SAM-dependent methyltransferase [Streptacidiphilus jiangxiensis]SEK47585.1 Methyltransferase domain-containing protein [Streptacidiphilus jiangxiensis]